MGRGSHRSIPVGILIRVDVEAVDDRLTEPSLGHGYPVPTDATKDTARSQGRRVRPRVQQTMLVSGCKWVST
jgi:hypothetical protein